MAETKKIKPANGLIVRDPISAQILPADGQEKEITNYWARRILAGDVVVVEDTLVAKEIKEKKGK